MTTELPIPTYLSPEAQAALARPIEPQTYPAVNDHAAWRALINEKNASVADLLRTFPVSAHTAVRDISGVPTYVVHRPDVGDNPDTPVYLDFHGGALIYLGGETVGAITAINATSTGVIHWGVDYRMAPEHPFPAALDDALTVYTQLLTERAPDKIIVGGQSAGGNLAAAVLLRAKAEHLPMPSCLVLLTPEVDLTESGDTFSTLREPGAGLGPLMPINLLYAAGRDLTDPYISPIFGDVAGFPPTFLQAGTRDLFLSNTVRMHRKLLRAGVPAELHIWDAMPHGGFMNAPEDQEIATEVHRFIRQHHRGNKTGESLPIGGGPTPPGLAGFVRAASLRS